VLRRATSFNPFVPCNAYPNIKALDWLRGEGAAGSLKPDGEGLTHELIGVAQGTPAGRAGLLCLRPVKQATASTHWENMQDLTHRELEVLVVRSYAIAYAYHGDLGLDLEAFSSHLYSIIRKRLGGDSSPAAALELVGNLYLSDIYLTLACSQGSPLAWNRFIALYGDPIRRICKCVCHSNDAAGELADSLPGQLFLPGATGRSRIASYGGFSPLSAWLTVIIKHCAVSEHRLRSHYPESIDQIHDVADHASILRIEAALRDGRYGELIRDSLQAAVSLLSDRERIILHLRYERQLQVSQVAQMFGIKPPSMTKQLDRARHKLRKGVASILATRHRLGPAGIEECVVSILENQECAVPVLT